MHTGILKSNEPRSFLILLVILGLSSHLRGQTPLGPYSGHVVAGRAVTVFAAPASVRFVFYTSDVLRVDFLPTPGSAPDSSFVVVQDTSAHVPFTVAETDSTLLIASSAVTVVCKKNPLRISYRDASGGTLLEEPASGGLATEDASRWAVFSLTGDEHFYGTGERGTGIDLRGQVFESYNTQVGGYSTPVATMKVNVPYLASSGGFALLFDNTWRGLFDLGHADPTRFWYVAEGGELTYYLIAASTFAEQLERFTWLTGRQPLPPRWALGFIQSKFGYQTEAEARSVVATMRQHRIPCDALVLDLYWFSHMGDLSWDAARWPSPFLMMNDFRSVGIKTMAITEPYIIQPSPNYGIAAANGFLGRTTAGQPYVLQNWWSCGCPAGLLDITNPAARSWWWSLHPSFMGSQMAGLWTDLGEPERHPEDMLHHLGPAPKVHNIYNLLWAKTVFDGFGQTYPDRRIMNLTRSGFAGIQRYGAITWSGDVAKSFGGLAVQLPILLGMGMSGLAYHNSDIGGFCCGTTTPELYVRWMQFGALCPVMRAHGASQPTEPWAFGPEAEEIVRNFIELRYRLLPYLYTLASENTATGMPLARPLIMDFPGEPAFTNNSDSYLLGEALLVSPVVHEGQRSQTVLLPSGLWVDFWTDTVLQGGQPVTREAPLERIPLFVRAGSIVPMGPVMQYTDEHPLDTLFLEMYPSTVRDACFRMYEDDGFSLAYRNGESATTLLVQRTVVGDSGTSLLMSIGASIGTFGGKLQRRVFLTTVHGVGSPPATVRRGEAPLPQRSSYDDLRRNGDGFFFDSAARLLYIHTPASTDSPCVVVAEDLTLAASVRPTDTLPGDVLLAQNYPNPFNGETKIGYGVSGIGNGSWVTLRVYDVLGRVVATLVDGKREPGLHSVSFDASGRASGVYLCRLQTGTFVQTRKMILIR